MPPAHNDLELTTQELIILGFLYTNPTIAKNYVTILQEQEIFSSKHARELWEKTYAYCKKYGTFPVSLEVKKKIFSKEQRAILRTAIRASQEDESRAKYLLDDAKDATKFAVYRDLNRRLGVLLDSSTPNISKIETLMRESYKKVTKLETLQSVTGVLTAEELLNQWANDELPTQMGRLPIGIKGLDEHYAGSPVGEVNYVVAAFGMGKSTLLSCMAAESAKHYPTLYVTLELPAAAVLFKILAQKSKGKIPMTSVFNPMEKVPTDVMERVLETSFDNPIFFMNGEAGGVSCEDISNYIELIYSETGVRIKKLYIDYGDLLATPRGGSMEDIGWAYMQKTSEAITALAKRHQVDTWTASQAGREAVSESLTEVNRGTKIKPVTSKTLWGSLGKMMTANIAVGFTGCRHPICTEIGAYVSTTLKNRYDKFHGMLLGTVNFATANINMQKIYDPTQLDDKRELSEILIEMMKQQVTMKHLRSQGYNEREATKILRREVEHAIDGIVQDAKDARDIDSSLQKAQAQQEILDDGLPSVSTARKKPKKARYEEDHDLLGGNEI